MDPLRQTDPLADGPIKAGGSGNERAPRLELPASDGPRNERFPALTGIRAVAAFLVFFHHLPLHLRPGFLMGLQNSFYSGVSFFFVLSGFLIAWRYYEEVRLSGSWLLQYFGNRFARIYPVYFLLLTIVVLLMKNADPIFLLQNYTLTHNLFFLFPSHGIAIAPSWSLTVEECFYLLAPFIFILSRKYKLGLPFFPDPRAAHPVIVDLWAGDCLYSNLGSRSLSILFSEDSLNFIPASGWRCWSGKKNGKNWPSRSRQPPCPSQHRSSP